MKVLSYWAARTALFLALWGALWLIQWRDVFAVVAAFVVAWLVGYLMFPKMRVAAGTELDGWIERFQAGHHVDDADEDAEAAAYNAIPRASNKP